MEGLSRSARTSRSDLPRSMRGVCCALWLKSAGLKVLDREKRERGAAATCLLLTAISCRAKSSIVVMLSM
jgi:hypothetical protein